METLIAFIVVLGVLIFVHELGHFLLAKLLGVGVLKFSLGFGPKLVGKKVGETEYLISAFPLGGYVKMVGEAPGEEVPKGMEEVSFTHKPLWVRALIVFAGPAFNMVFAVLILSTLLIYGVPTLTTRIGEVKEGMPAYKAGIRAGDVVVSVMGKPVERWEELAQAIRNSTGPISMKLKRDGKIYKVRVTPVVSKVKNLFGEEEEVRIIGITSAGEVMVVRHDPFTALYKGTYQSLRLIGLTILGMKKLIEGKVAIKESLGGPILIAQLAGEQVKHGLSSFIFFIALLSVNLAIINLFPIPVLDGGHLLLFAIEFVLRRPLSEKSLDIAHKIGIVIIALLMVLVFYSDIMRLLEG